MNTSYNILNISANYYPFGMMLPGRSFSDDSYRYGFQGQEKDDEIKVGEGTSINYKYRMHDPRLGRFFAIDPLTSKYPFYTPYSFSGNRVIHRIELEGLEDVTYLAKWNNSTGNYDMPIKITSATPWVTSGTLYMYEGGSGQVGKGQGNEPIVPKGWDCRMIMYDDNGKLLYDRVSKNAGTIIKEYRFVIKVENTTSVEAGSNVKKSVYNAEAKYTDQINKTTLTLSEDGVSIKTEEPKVLMKAGGGMLGTTLTYEAGSDGSESTQVKAGPIALTAKKDGDGSQTQNFLLSLPVKSAKVAAAGLINNNTIIKIGYEREGPTSVDYNEATKK